MSFNMQVCSEVVHRLIPGMALMPPNAFFASELWALLGLLPYSTRFNIYEDASVSAWVTSGLECNLVFLYVQLTFFWLMLSFLQCFIGIFTCCQRVPRSLFRSEAGRVGRGRAAIMLNACLRLCVRSAAIDRVVARPLRSIYMDLYARLQRCMPLDIFW